MFKNGKIVGLSLALSCVSGVGAQFAVADGETEIVSDEPSTFANLTARELEDILDDVHRIAENSKFNRDLGYIEKSEEEKKEVERLVKKYNLNVFLMYEDNLEPYAALFDLDFCEDLDHDVDWALDVKDNEMRYLINLDAMYTKRITRCRNDLRSHRWKDEGFVKKNLASYYTSREVVRKRLALCVAKHGLTLEKHFISAGQEENTNGVSNQEREVNTQSDTSKKKSNQEQQSLVRTDAVSNESWGFLDIVFGIKDKVKSLLGWNEKEREFVSKEEDLKREAKRQETEFSLSLLVKRFLDMVRGSDSIGALDKNENIKKNNSGSSANSLASMQNNLLTDGTEGNHQ